MDPTAIEIKEVFPDTEDTRFPNIVGKIGIDATKPALFRVNERRIFERAWPINWGKVRLADYLSKAHRIAADRAGAIGCPFFLLELRAD